METHRKRPLRLIWEIGPLALISNAALEACLAALAHLSEPDRDLLLLVAWDGLSPEQAGTALGISAGSVKSHTSRAMASLATRLEDHR